MVTPDRSNHRRTTPVAFMTAHAISEHIALERKRLFWVLKPHPGRVCNARTRSVPTYPAEFRTESVHPPPALPYGLTPRYRTSFLYWASSSMEKDVMDEKPRSIRRRVRSRAKEEAQIDRLVDLGFSFADSVGFFAKTPSYTALVFITEVRILPGYIFIHL